MAKQPPIAEILGRVIPSFPGEYKVIVDRTWGRPLGDKAKLEIVRHQGTPDETVELVTVNLATAQSLSVKLDQGRRTTAAASRPAPRW